MRRAFWHQGATLTKNRRNAFHDVLCAGTLAQDFDLPLDCPALMGNGYLSEQDAISRRD
jgi:hypothetical protein